MSDDADTRHDWRIDETEGIATCETCRLAVPLVCDNGTAHCWVVRNPRRFRCIGCGLDISPYCPSHKARYHPPDAGLAPMD